MNEGTNSNPVFTDYTVLESGGSQIYHYRANPRIFDLDDDGLKDLIVGQNDGRIYFYQNVGTNPDPQFNGYELLQTEGGTIIDAYAGSRFCFTDWTGDGDIDFLVSGYYGYIEYYENNNEVNVTEDKAVLLKNLTLRPNPVNKSVIVSYSLAQPGHVKVDVYSTDGRLVATPLEGHADLGKHQLSWNVHNLSAGVYFVKITAGTETTTARMLVVR